MRCKEICKVEEREETGTEDVDATANVDFWVIYVLITISTVHYTFNASVGPYEAS